MIDTLVSAALCGLPVERMVNAEPVEAVLWNRVTQRAGEVKLTTHPVPSQPSGSGSVQALQTVMAEQNLDIVVRIRGGQVASQEVKQVGQSIEGVGTATEKTTKKTGGLNKALVGIATGFLAYKGAGYVKSAVNTPRR